MSTQVLCAIRERCSRNASMSIGPASTCSSGYGAIRLTTPM
jgi:hypothetical protein